MDYVINILHTLFVSEGTVKKTIKTYSHLINKFLYFVVKIVMEIKKKSKRVLK